MAYNFYTQNALVKNPQELIKNKEILIRNGVITGFQELSKSGFKSAENTKNNHMIQIISPGFFNLHCHLAYTNFNLKEEFLFTWLGHLVEASWGSNTNNSEAIKQSYLNGAQEALKSGTTFLIDNSLINTANKNQDELINATASIEAFENTGLRGILGVEIFGSDPQKAQEIFNQQIKLTSKILKIIQQKNLLKPKLGLCLSPHSTYNTCKELWQLCQTWSDTNNSILLSHVAESQVEEEWFKNAFSLLEEENKKSLFQILNSGAKQKDNITEIEKQIYEFLIEIHTNIESNNKQDLIKEFSKAVLLWHKTGTLEAKLLNWQSYNSSVEYLHNNNLLNKNSLLTHLVQASKNDLHLLKEQNISLVSCPRSNEFLKNGLAHIQDWEDLGLLYGIGTDSKASNYDLDIRKEVNRLSEVFNISSKRKLELLTTNAAKIVNKENELGTLDIGKQADFTIFEVEVNEVKNILENFTNKITGSQKNLYRKILEEQNINLLSDNEILDLLFDTRVSKVKEVFINGNSVYNSLIK